jgi:hypothetical protein
LIQEVSADAGGNQADGQDGCDDEDHFLFHVSLSAPLLPSPNR